MASKRHASLASEFVLSTVPLADGLGLALDVMVLLPETVVVGERLGIEEDDADTVDDVLALCPGVRLAVRVIVLLPVMLVLAIDVIDCDEDGDTEPAAEGDVVFGDVMFVCSLRTVSARRPQALSRLARDVKFALLSLLLSLRASIAWSARAPGRVTDGMTTVTNMAALHESVAHELLA